MKKIQQLTITEIIVDLMVIIGIVLVTNNLCESLTLLVVYWTVKCNVI